eukprot:TRINITY_DN1500_c0_g1_i1.p1 TRINITY_DN1500_c0_g1~~TRINITY_DN1500_c0_g1_i1.p1  ORF type:complete len:749 (-),score=270.80 TRINITY_DN1500_c0_g1_i1:83-2329(-)
MSVVGIDFGTSKCVVVGIHGGEVKVVLNEVSNRKTPTFVGYGGKHRFLGEAGLSRMASNFTNTVPGSFLKKCLGKKFSSPEVQAEIAGSPLTISADEEDRVVVQVEHDDQKLALSIDSVAGALFGHLKRTAESYLGVSVAECVIGVPSFFTDAQRRAVADAAKIGGFHVLGLMNETSAVALQYGLLRPLPKDKTMRVLFVDLGYAHMNCSVVNFKEGELTVAGSYTDPSLGGRNFDLIVAEHMAEHILKTFKLDVKKNKKAWIRVQKEAENIKKVLSANADVHWGMECLMDDKDVKGVVTRVELEAIAQPLLDRIVVALEKLLHSCKLTAKDIDSIEVVGGSVRIPVVVARLESFFGSAVSRTCDGDESVGRGCALFSAMLSPKFKVLDFKVNDISPYPIEVIHGSVNGTPDGISTIFDQFNAIPSVKAMTFKREDPLEISFRYQDVSLLPESTDPSISKFYITGIPKASDPELKPKLKVKMKLDVSGIVSVPSATLFEEYWVDEVVKVEAPAAGAPAAEGATPEAKAEAAADSKMDTTPDNDNEMDTTPDVEVPSSAAPAPEAPKADAPADGAAPAEPATQIVKKKKVRKSELPIEEVAFGALTKAKFQVARDVELKMTQADKTVLYTLARKNDLESFIYDIRDKVQFEALPTASEEAKSSFLVLLDEAEEWLYNEGFDAQAADYVDRLVNLRKLSDPLITPPPPPAEPEPAAESREEAASSPDQPKGDVKSNPAAPEERAAEAASQ